MIKYTRAIFVFALVVNQNLSIGQTNPNIDYEPVVHSPQMNAFAKFTDFPISLYTGQAEVSVPIYDLVVGDISVPISLQYHTGGVKVEDIASWVGTNWNLNAGAKIIRDIRGLPDFFDPAWYYEPMYFDSPTLDKIGHTAYGEADGEHDLYYYSAGSYSGKFVHDLGNQLGNDIDFVTFPKEDIVIDIDGQDVISITTPDGLTYTFGKKETNYQRNFCSVSGSAPAAYTQYEPLGWFLTRIESSKTQAYVDFNYADKRLIYDQNGIETINEVYGILNGPPPLDEVCTIKNDIYTHRLTSINASDGQMVSFNIGAERKDLFGDHILDNIVVSHSNSNDTKKYNLKHKYQSGSNFYDLDHSSFASITEHAEGMRLFLMGVEEVDDNGQTIPIADFTYNLTSGLPSRRSYSQDELGYFNGASNYFSKVRATYHPNGFYLSGANRNPSLEHAIQGSLKTIKAATGGTRTFTYGLNQCDNCTFGVDYGTVPYPSYIDHSTDGLNWKLSGPGTYEGDFSASGPGELWFYVDAATAYYGTGGPKASAKLFSLNANGTINEEVFDSDDHWENESDLTTVTYSMNYEYSGDYRLQLVLLDNTWEYDQFELIAKVQPPYVPPSGPVTVGGLRVESIDLFDPITNDVINRSYEYGSGYMNVIAPQERIARHLEPQNDPTHQTRVSWAYFRRSSSPIIPSSPTKGGVVGYDKVTVRELGNGYSENYFYSSLENPDQIIPGISQAMSTTSIQEVIPGPTSDINGSISGEQEAISWKEFPFGIWDDKDWKRGLLKKKLVYREDGTLLRSIENKYNFYDELNDPSYDPSKIKSVSGISVSGNLIYIIELMFGGLPVEYWAGEARIRFYRLQSSWYDLDEVIEVNYFDGQAVTTTTKYEYSPNQRSIKSTSIVDSNGEEVKTTAIFPTDDAGVASNPKVGQAMAQTLVDKNFILQPLSQSKEVNSVLVSELVSTYEINADNINMVKAEAFSNASSNPNVTDLAYDEFGNVVQVEGADGITTVFLWGYENRYPIAKIENAAYSEIANAEILQLRNLSSQDDDHCLDSGGCDEKQLRIRLNNLRTALPDAMVTTYTYDPLIGMTSQTDPTGYTIYYEYDDFDRLEATKDHNGNILQEYKYEYGN